MNPYSSTGSDDSKHELERALFVERSPEAFQRRIKHLRATIYKVSILPEDEPSAVSPEVAMVAENAFQPTGALRKLESPVPANIIQFPNRQRLDAKPLATSEPQAGAETTDDMQNRLNDAHNKLAEIYKEAA